VHEAVADTSVLQYLFQADGIHLLPALYGQVVVPVAVAEELDEGRSLGHALPDPQTRSAILELAGER